MRSKKMAWILFGIVIVFYIGVYIWKSREIKLLLKHHSIANGIITKFNKNGKGDADQIVYSFSIGNHNYYDMASFRVKDHLGENFVGRNFPVIFDVQNFDNHAILIYPENFHFFKLEFPDSLNWVKYYIFQPEK